MTDREEKGYSGSQLEGDSAEDSRDTSSEL